VRRSSGTSRGGGGEYEQKAEEANTGCASYVTFLMKATLNLCDLSQDLALRNEHSRVSPCSNRMRWIRVHTLF
jgi:hypothetical protein